MPSKTTQIVRWAGAIVMLLLIVMLMAEGTWATGLQHSWPFVVTCAAAVALLAIAGARDCKGRHWAGALSHLGMALVLIGGMLGAVVETDCKMVVDRHASERVAYTKADEAVVVPFALRLEDFRIDYYEDGESAKQYTSILRVDKETYSTSVNHPLRLKGWWIYQQDYDHANGEFVILELVRDPLLPLVYIGMGMMVLGALITTRRAWQSRKVLPATLALAAVFTAASLARIELGTLVPALRSLWFFPHILIYMIAYSLLAIATVVSGIGTFRDRPEYSELGGKLLTTTSSLLLIGMICGAIWAKDAWGQYWTWDAKECWAAVTWLVTVVGTHVPWRRFGRWATLVVIVITFAAMQVTWYGVNYLPSAEYSRHTYNK